MPKELAPDQRAQAELALGAMDWDAPMMASEVNEAAKLRLGDEGAKDLLIAMCQAGLARFKGSKAGYVRTGQPPAAEEPPAPPTVIKLALPVFSQKPAHSGALVWTLDLVTGKVTATTWLNKGTKDGDPLFVQQAEPDAYILEADALAMTGPALGGRREALGG